LGNVECCGAACGDILICCSTDETSLGIAAQRRHDKRPGYSATATFHNLPCAFMCTPSLAYGFADSVLSLVWFLQLIAVIAATILVVVRLDSADGATPLLNEVFIVLYVSIALLLAT